VKAKFLATILFAASLLTAPAQSNPASSGAVDTETELSLPDAAVYLNSCSETYSASDFNFWETVEINWSEASGGDPDYVSSEGTNDFAVPPDVWPSAAGTETFVSENGSYGIGDTFFYDAYLYHGSESGTYYSGTPDQASWSLSGEDQLTFLTGGAPGTTGYELYELAGSSLPATGNNPSLPTYFGNPIPPTQLSFGAFGSLNSNGVSWAVLPVHTKADASVTVNGSPGLHFAGVSWATGYRLVSQCLATTPSNLSRTTLGVGEQVDLYFNPSLPVNAVWSTTAGSVAPITNTITQFIAPSNAATATVTATVEGKSVSMTFKVVEPTGIDHASIIATNNVPAFPNLNLGQSGAGMELSVVFGPTNVSFYRVAIMEIPENGTNIYGYFSQYTPEELYHSTGGHWTQLNQANQLVDSAGNGPDYPPFSAGVFSWNIPGAWQVTDTGQTNSMGGCTQSVSIDSSGTVTVQKLNCSVTRTTNNVITTTD
jgi:hypothetical protein